MSPARPNVPLLDIRGYLLESRNRLTPSFVFRPLSSLLESQQMFALSFVFGPLSFVIVSQTPAPGAVLGRLNLYRSQSGLASSFVFGPLGFVIEP
jgi:hypothetical protein